jgi:hypothetical protein
MVRGVPRTLRVSETAAAPISWQMIRLLPVLVVMLAGCAPAADHRPDLALITGGGRSHADFVRRLNEAARRHGSTADLEGHFQDRDAATRFAAIYLAALWAHHDKDIRAMTPLLSDPDEAIRAMVAGSLSGLGDADAARVFAALSTSSAVMPYSEPPLRVGDFVRATSAQPAARTTHNYERHSPFRRVADLARKPWSLLPIVEAASTLTSDPATITITVPIDVVGGSETLIALWHAGIDDAWNHGNHGTAFEVCGRKVQFVPQFRRLPPDANTSRDAHVIVVEEVRPGQYYVSTVWHAAGTSPTESARTGFWGSNASPTTAAHEFGHLLGLDDEYIENDVNGNATRDPGETPIPDTSKYSDAAQSAMGVHEGAVLPRHVEAAVAGHDVAGTLDCAQEVLIRGVYNAQPQNEPLCNGARARIEVKLTLSTYEWSAEGSGEAWIEWRRHNPCPNTLWGGTVTKPGATAKIKVLHMFDGSTKVSISGDDLTESFLIDGKLVADGKAILPYWLGLVKGTNVEGTLAEFSISRSAWKEGATFTFENRAGDAKPMMRNYGSATLEVCRKSSAGPFAGCTLP